MNKKSLHTSTQNIWGSIPDTDTALLPQSTLHIVCSEATIHTPAKEISCLLHKLKFPLSSPQQQSVAQQPHILLLEDLFSSHVCLSSQSKLLPSGFQTKIVCAIFISTTLATCSSHLILLNLFTPIILCEKHKLQSCSLCSPLHPPITSTIFNLNILLL